jgi:GntR family transcriptional repressor for pyruvate dehydrogenase complex
MHIEPIRRRSVVHDAIAKLKELIDHQYFKSGQKLPPERELAKLLGISLPSLREALRALSILGVVDMRPGSGTFLKDSLDAWSHEAFSLFFDLNPSIHLDLFEARIGIEGFMAELAAKKRTADDLKRMEVALRAMKANLSDKTEYIRHEIEFHRAIIGAAKNVVLQTFMEKMYKILHESRKQTVQQLTDVYHASYLDHDTIYRCIKKADAREARRAMIAKLAKVEKRFRRTLMRGTPYVDETAKEVTPGAASGARAI